MTYIKLNAITPDFKLVNTKVKTQTIKSPDGDEKQNIKYSMMELGVPGPSGIPKPCKILIPGLVAQFPYQQDTRKNRPSFNITCLLDASQEDTKRGYEIIDQKIREIVVAEKKDIFKKDSNLPDIVIESRYKPLADYRPKEKDDGSVYSPTISLRAKMYKGQVKMRVIDEKKNAYAPEQIVKGTNFSAICVLSPLWITSNGCNCTLQIESVLVHSFGEEQEEELFDFEVENTSHDPFNLNAPASLPVNTGMLNSADPVSPTKKKSVGGDDYGPAPEPVSAPKTKKSSKRALPAN